MSDNIKELIPYAVIIIVVVLFRSFIATPIKVNGTSMYNTLKGNEICILNKLSKIDRNDIVVTNYEGEKLIKRVIALPGETIEVYNGDVYINDRRVSDKYAYSETDDFDKVKLKDNEYFLMGDNRSVSKDSRIIGPVKKENITGTTNFILFPFNKIGKIDK